MKPIQIMIDEALLERLDRDPEVRRSGRSAVLRNAAAAYLRRSSARRIAEGYRKAYGRGSGLGADFSGWEDEGTWPGK
jgi:metal-responsive CopG/Arc/MetJ family transcriptional regulator